MDSTFRSVGSLGMAVARSWVGLESFDGDLGRCKTGLSGSTTGADGAAGKGKGDGRLSLFHSGFWCGLGGVARAATISDIRRD